MELIAAQLCIVKQIIFGISPPFFPHYMLCILNLFCSVICGVCLRYCGLYSKCRTCQFCYEMTKVILNIESLYFWRLQTCQREPLLALGSLVRGPLFLQLPHSIASSVISSLFTNPPPERKYRRPTRYITEGFKPLIFFSFFSGCRARSVPAARLQTDADLQATAVPVEMPVGPRLSRFPEVLPHRVQVLLLRESGVTTHLCHCGKPLRIILLWTER